jgi:CARDB protein
MLVLGAACAVACIALPAALASTTVPVPVPPGKAKLRVKPHDCQKALDPGQRTISITAVMRPVPGTRAMQLKFDLLTKTAGAPGFTEVNGGDLGTWISPTDATLGRRAHDVWVLNHPVADLPAPALYRFQVSFRWIGAHRRVIAAVVRNGPKCFQQELRPDLQVQSVTVTPNDKGTKDRYDATVYNGGLSPAGPFIVDFTYQDPTTGTPVVVPANVPGLRRHRSVDLEFIGPVCKSTAPPTIEIDPAGQVDDYNTDNNTYHVVCPS